VRVMVWANESITTGQCLRYPVLREFSGALNKEKKEKKRKKKRKRGKKQGKGRKGGGGVSCG